MEYRQHRPANIPTAYATALPPQFQAANENLKVKSDWMTPAEALQTIIKMKDKLRAENAKSFVLFHSAARRRNWDEINACEACLRWMYFRH